MAAPPPELLAWLKAFDAGAYYEAAHDALYDAWFDHRSVFYQGLQILAAGLLHAGTGNSNGARIKLEKARRRLVDYRPSYLGINVTLLVGYIDTCLEQIPPTDGRERSEALSLPRHAVEFDAATLRGDEPELQREP